MSTFARSASRALLRASCRRLTALAPLRQPLLHRHLSSSLPRLTLAASSPSSPPSTTSGAYIAPRLMHLTFPSGARSSFHHVWLRDHCREERSYHPSTRQRLVDTASIPEDLCPLAVLADAEGIRVSWPETPTEGSYESFFPWAFLEEYSYDPPVVPESGKEVREKVYWTSEIGKDPPKVSYEQVMESEEGVYEWVKRIDTFGFSLVSGIPPTPEATDALLRRIAFIRETHYGGFWDFTADLQHGDLAYSDLPLRAHTDTTYFTDPCGLQLFHLLSPSTSHQGGHNLLVDGFRAATIFRSLHPTLYALFSTLPIPSHASGTGSASSPSGVHMSPLVRMPVFSHDEGGELVQVRWNGDDRGAVGGTAWEGKMGEWFEGVRKWEEVLRSQEAELWSVMEAGTAVIFDNHRVLHGRSAFTGERRLCGGYIAGDDYRSRLRGLEMQFGKKAATTRRGTGVWEGYICD